MAVAFEAKPTDLSTLGGAPRPLVLWVLRIVAQLAAAISGYLAWMGLSGGEVAGCGGGAMDCDAVLASGWAKWFGIPVGLLGFSLYLSLLGTLAFAGPVAPTNVRRLAWQLSTWLIYAAAAAGLWFVHLQWLDVRAFCPWCMTVHACAIGMAILAMADGRESATQKLLAVGVGLAGVAVLAGGQWLQPAPAPQVATERLKDGPTAAATRFDIRSRDRIDIDDHPAGISMSDLVLHDPPTGHDTYKPPIEVSSALGANGKSGDGLSDDPLGLFTPGASIEGDSPTRMITVFVGNGQVAQVDTYQHPILGSPQARHVVVKLFDYTCRHCRDMHAHLAVAREQFGDDLAVLLLPVPMNPDCNPHVASRSATHADACQLAALALAVWQADATKFAEFDAWIFAPEHPPSIHDAREKAISLVGEKNLDEALGDWRLSQRMAVGIELYKMAGTGSIPKLLLPRTKLTGGVTNGQELAELLARELGIQ